MQPGKAGALFQPGSLVNLAGLRTAAFSKAPSPLLRSAGPLGVRTLWFMNLGGRRRTTDGAVHWSEQRQGAQAQAFCEERALVGPGEDVPPSWT